eukprot:COSAG06_NODE_56242_length_285_cov_1.940860_1_plen_45_part_10
MGSCLCPLLLLLLWVCRAAERGEMRLPPSASSYDAAGALPTPPFL